MADYYVDPSAQVSESVRIGSGTKVWAFTRILDNAIVGRNCQFGQNVFIDRSVTVGNHVKVQNNVSIYMSVDIADGVFLGPSCVFTNVEFPRSFVERKSCFSPTKVSRGVTVGANATIVCGVTLAEFSFIGAGAVVTRDTLPFSLVVGNPARRMGWACACGERLPVADSHASRCDRCGFAYELDATSCRPADRSRFDEWWHDVIG